MMTAKFARRFTNVKATFYFVTGSMEVKEKQCTVCPHILLHALKSEVYQHFEFRLLVANCMQLLPEGLYSGPAIIGWGEVCSYHGIDHYRWGTKEGTYMSSSWYKSGNIIHLVTSV